MLFLALFYSGSISLVFWFLLHWRNQKNLCPWQAQAPTHPVRYKEDPIWAKPITLTESLAVCLLIRSTTKHAPEKKSLFNMYQKAAAVNSISFLGWRGLLESDWCIPSLDSLLLFLFWHWENVKTFKISLASLTFSPKLCCKSLLYSVIRLFPLQLAMRALKLQVLL